MADEEKGPETTAERAARIRKAMEFAASTSSLPKPDPNPSFPAGTNPDGFEPILDPNPVQTQAAKESQSVADAIRDSNVSPAVLEAALDDLLKKKAQAKREAFDPKEPDYSKLTEADYYNPEFYIPVIQHDIPEYMHVKLRDTSYVAVWASLDQRRIGQLLAEGYETLRKEMVDPNFHLPLKFNSEGLYIYQDVVCMRVHKRIKIAKLRKVQEISANQLKRAGADERVKGKIIDAVLGDPYLENAFINKGLGFYDPTPQ